MHYLLGQFFGIVTLIASVVMPLYQKKWQMLANTIVINLSMALNFVLIGEIGSAAALCTIAVIQCIVSLFHTARDSKPSNAETVVFFILYLGFGFFGLINSPGFVWGVNRHNLLELMPIAGSICNMIFVFIRNEQHARWCLLTTCVIWAVYTGLIGAASFFAQCFTIATTVYAIYRYRMPKVSDAA